MFGIKAMRQEVLALRGQVDALKGHPPGWERINKANIELFGPVEGYEASPGAAMRVAFGALYPGDTPWMGKPKPPGLVERVTRLESFMEQTKEASRPKCKTCKQPLPEAGE